ncbi:MAG: cadherin-like domain-containing protein, partial [Planctomycetales bacterium]|nr:cadherin-like domain-containing protein [Planctomycetales bacterium]
VWVKQIRGGENAYVRGDDVAVNASGDVFIAGGFTRSADFDPGPQTRQLVSAGSQDAFTLKLNSQGDFAWVHSMGASGSDSAYQVEIDPFGDPVFAGSFEGEVDFDPGPGVLELSTDGGSNIFVQKLTQEGELIWARIAGAANASNSMSLAVGQGGEIYTASSFQGTSDFDPGPEEYTLDSLNFWSVYVHKLDSHGEFVWAKAVGRQTPVPTDVGVAVDRFDEVYLGGSFVKTADFDPGPGTLNFVSKGQEDAFLVKLYERGRPEAVADSYEVAEDELLQVSAPGLLVNDVDPAGAGLSVVVVDDVDHGELSWEPDGGFTYRPNADYNGADRFSYFVSDGAVASAVVEASITVNPVEDTLFASITPVSPNPRGSVVETMEIVFSEPVTGVDVSDFTLFNYANYRVNLLTGAETVASSDDGRTYLLGGLGPLTEAEGTYRLELRARDSEIFDLGGAPLATVDVWTNWVKYDPARPTAIIQEVAPDPHAGSVDQVVIEFSRPVTGVDADSFWLRRRDDNQIISLEHVEVSSSDGGITYVLTGLADVTRGRGTYELTLRPEDIVDAEGRPLAASVVEQWTNLGDPNVTPPGSAPYFQVDKLLETGGAAGDEFGGLVALSSDGKTLAATAPGGGAAYVFRWDETAGQFVEAAELSPSDDTELSVYGDALAISADGDTIAVHGVLRQPLSYYAIRNIVFVYRWNAAKGQFVETRFNASYEELYIFGSTQFIGKFGSTLSVSGDGDLIAIGAPESYVAYETGPRFTGYSYVYRWNGQDYEYDTFLVSHVPSQDDRRFGDLTTISDDGQMVVVAHQGTVAIEGSEVEGGVEVFRWNSTKFDWFAALPPPSPKTTLAFHPTSIDVGSDGETIVVGAEVVDAIRGRAHRAFVYRRDGR